jgi:NADH-quinone oxidoreductase subunit E
MDKLQPIIDRYKNGQGTLIAVLQDISQAYGYLPEDILREVSRQIEVPVSRFYSLATFYRSFRLEPMGKNHVCVCVGTACHVRGAARLVDTLERELAIRSGQTTEDGRVTLETVACVGACAMGPLVVVNGSYHGNMDQKKLGRLIKELDGEGGAALGGEAVAGTSCTQAKPSSRARVAESTALSRLRDSAAGRRRADGPAGREDA